MRNELLFKNSLVEWQKMKAGFEDIIARYPDLWNLNNYAKFACLAKDKTKTQELITKIGNNLIIEAWEKRELFDRCQTWAFKK